MKLPPFTFFPLILIAPATAQTIGGGYDTEFQIHGLESGGQFGEVLADAGDVNGDGISDLLVGSPNADWGAASKGAVAIHSGADGTRLNRWVGEHKGDQFGTSVAAAGDLNLDGMPDFLIGAKNAENSNGYATGAVYAYSGADGSLLKKWTGVQPGQGFGASVAAIQDLDADGIPDVIIGSPHRTDAFSNSGTVEVYSGLTDTLIHTWSGPFDDAKAGTQVADIGDFDGDGVHDICLSAPGATAGSFSNYGAIFYMSGADGSMLKHLKSPFYHNNFGVSFANAGDVDQDGVNDLIVGADNRSKGHAYVYSGRTDVQLFRFYGKFYGSRFGASVASAGDVDEDGVPDFLIGDPTSKADGLIHAGSTYVYSGTDGQLLWQRDGENENDRLGTAVARIGQGSDPNKFAVSMPWRDLHGFQKVGSVDVISAQPFLQATATSISLAAGGIEHFAIDFPREAAGYEYKLLASKSGNGPFHYGVDIPLTYDITLQRTWDGNYHGPYAGGHHGTLDADGNALAFFSMEPGRYSGLAGITLQLAAVAMPTGGLPEYSSVAVPFEFLP